MPREIWEADEVEQHTVAAVGRVMRLLDDALEALDGIATEPSDLNDGYDHYKAARVVAKTAAKHIRTQLES